MPSRNHATKKTTRKTSKTSSYFTRSKTRVVKKVHHGQTEKFLLEKDENEKTQDDTHEISQSSSILDNICLGHSEVAIDDALAVQEEEVAERSVDVNTGNGLDIEKPVDSDTAFSEISKSVEYPVGLNQTQYANDGGENGLVTTIEPAQSDTDVNPVCALPSEHEQPKTTKIAKGSKEKRSKSGSPLNKKPPPKLSPYFPKPLPLIDSSCLPFPPISAPSFGLIQEQLACDPFKLLIATIFLNRTRGPVAIPVLFKLFEKYPTIQSMAEAQHGDIVDIIHNLGFQNQRATKFIALAKKWLESPPERGRRYRKLNYPCKKDGSDIGAGEIIGDDDDDQRVAWEIAHLPGIGAYAIDSWRIFCRDRLRGLPLQQQQQQQQHPIPSDGDDSDQTNRNRKGYEPEWKRVLPQDKELRAYLTWMWLKEGYVWDWETGKRTSADAEMMERAKKGGIAYEAPNGNWVLENTSTIIQLDEKQLLPVRKAGFSLDYS